MHQERGLGERTETFLEREQSEWDEEKGKKEEWRKK